MRGSHGQSEFRQGLCDPGQDRSQGGRKRQQLGYSAQGRGTSTEHSGVGEDTTGVVRGETHVFCSRLPRKSGRGGSRLRSKHLRTHKKSTRVTYCFCCGVEGASIGVIAAVFKDAVSLAPWVRVCWNCFNALEGADHG